MRPEMGYCHVTGLRFLGHDSQLQTAGWRESQLLLQGAHGLLNIVEQPCSGVKNWLALIPSAHQAFHRQDAFDAGPAVMQRCVAPPSTVESHAWRQIDTPAKSSIPTDDDRVTTVGT